MFKHWGKLLKLTCFLSAFCSRPLAGGLSFLSVCWSCVSNKSIISKSEHEVFYLQWKSLHRLECKETNGVCVDVCKPTCKWEAEEGRRVSPQAIVCSCVLRPGLPRVGLFRPTRPLTCAASFLDFPSCWVSKCGNNLGAGYSPSSILAFFSIKVCFPFSSFS